MRTNRRRARTDKKLFDAEFFFYKLGNILGVLFTVTVTYEDYLIFVIFRKMLAHVFNKRI